MIEFLQVLGLILLVISLSVGTVLVIRYGRRHGGFGFGSGSNRGKANSGRSASSAPITEMEQPNLNGPYWWNNENQPVIYVDDEPFLVKARIALHEMTQLSTDAPWSRTGIELLALLLQGDQWVMKIRRRERDQPVWLIGERVSTDKLGPFYIGTEVQPGPARRFRLNNQTSPIAYDLPGHPGGRWEVTDIGTFAAEVPEEQDDVWAVKNGDRLYFVTSWDEEGRCLLYFDARQGEAKGDGGLFLFEEFTPQPDVMDLL